MIGALEPARKRFARAAKLVVFSLLLQPYSAGVESFALHKPISTEHQLNERYIPQDESCRYGIKIYSRSLQTGQFVAISLGLTI